MTKSIVETINTLMRGAGVPQPGGARITTATDAGGAELSYYIIIDAGGIKISNGDHVVCAGFDSEAQARASHFFWLATRFVEWRKGTDGFYVKV